MVNCHDMATWNWSRVRYHGITCRLYSTVSRIASGIEPAERKEVPVFQPHLNAFDFDWFRCFGCGSSHVIDQGAAEFVCFDAYYIPRLIFPTAAAVT